MELTLQCNARLQPKHRFPLEDAIDELLEKEGLGEVTGGGTSMNPDHEIAYCTIDIYLKQSTQTALMQLVSLLTNQVRIPKGSLLQSKRGKMQIGTLEGLAYYSNGIDLPDEVYQTCDINYVIEQMSLAMDGIGKLYSYWEGNEHTALYFYGSSFAKMKESIEPFVKTYPLCQKCRIEQIA